MHISAGDMEPVLEPLNLHILLGSRSRGNILLETGAGTGAKRSVNTLRKCFRSHPALFFYSNLPILHWSSLSAVNSSKDSCHLTYLSVLLSLPRYSLSTWTGESAGSRRGKSRRWVKSRHRNLGLGYLHISPLLMKH